MRFWKYLGGGNISCHLLRDAWKFAFIGVKHLIMKFGARWDQGIICFCIRAGRRMSGVRGVLLAQFGFEKGAHFGLCIAVTISVHIAGLDRLSVRVPLLDTKFGNSKNPGIVLNTRFDFIVLALLFNSLEPRLIFHAYRYSIYKYATPNAVGLWLSQLTSRLFFHFFASL